MTHSATPNALPPLTRNAIVDARGRRLGWGVHAGAGIALVRRIRPLFLLTFAVLVQAYPVPLAAQTLDVVVDIAVGSGVTAGQGDGETLSRRTPLFVDVDAGFILDEDFETEWGLGMLMQLEDQVAVGLTPQVRLVRPVWVGEVYAGLGAPVFIVPAISRVGVELQGGALFRLHEQFSGLVTIAADVFFAGDDVPGDDPVLMFNLGIGGRVRL